MDITVENVQETIEKISKYSIKKEKEFDGVVRKYAKAVAKQGQSNVSPMTKKGNLKKSIKPKYFTKHGPAATVMPRAKYARHRHLIEHGTKDRTQKKTGRFVGRVTPRPFMTSAAKAEESAYLSEIKKVVDTVDTV